MTVLFPSEPFLAVTRRRKNNFVICPHLPQEMTHNGVMLIIYFYSRAKFNFYTVIKVYKQYIEKW